jgi:hypothetical protein
MIHVTLPLSPAVPTYFLGAHFLPLTLPGERFRWRRGLSADGRGYNAPDCREGTVDVSR